ncbi:MAG: ABC transporter permease subunit [Phycisphaeraceae bacterium]|nr:ABC transporter permease subunit [Phycisphaerae bacterium]MBX3392769.1 ABC transporter permease subunit [Phycisphaeraceae bacterium]HRJ49736.1 ABC transporter permease subunit [Phycisphaerales bacterium]
MAAMAVAWREFCSYFRLPVGWIAIALYLFLSGIVFAYLIFNPGQPATMRPFFTISVWLLLPVAPAVTMRLVSEELRSGTIEPLMTAPVTDGAVVVGKYLGAAGFLGVMVAPTAAYPLTLWMVSDPAPDPGPILAGYLSLGLLGMLYAAVGLWMSSLTSNQTLAFLGTLFFLLVTLLATTIGHEHAPAWLRPALAEASIQSRLVDFSKGVIDTSHVVFFVATSAMFVTLAVFTVESRRWIGAWREVILSAGVGLVVVVLALSVLLRRMM